ncbi:DUF2971 domain-containing protein [Nocardioides sp. GXZ039]|uniref:DUF2971 domain-containing protein n=1 Tax=Nocardioides sp. GXZ039 TaxID=3136018 RepID=UPI0030F4A29D
MAQDEHDEHEEHAETDDDGLVWHYTDAQGLLSILSSHTLWATSSRFLNDAGEVELGWRALHAELERRAASDEFFAALLEHSDDAPEAFQQQESSGGAGPSDGEFFVLSATRHWDLLAVWRNYGGRGESYAIGLDPNAPLAAIADRRPSGSSPIRHLCWAPVRYTSQERQALVDAVFDDLKDEIEWVRDEVAAGADRAEIEAGVATLLEDMEQALLLIKHEGFADERETRHSSIVLPGHPDMPPGLVRFRATAYGLAPYLRLTGGTEAPVVTEPAPLPIRALAISPSPYSRASARTLRSALHAHGYPSLPIHTSGIPFRE